MSTKRLIHKLYIVSLLLSIFIFFLFYNSIQKIIKLDIGGAGIKIVDSINKDYMYYIDSVEKVNKKIYIEGWFLKKGENNYLINRVIVLKDSKNNYYKLFTKSVYRPGLTEHFADGNNYNYTGLIAKGKITKTMSPPFKVYILTKENNQNILIDVDKVINWEEEKR